MPSERDGKIQIGSKGVSKVAAGVIKNAVLPKSRENKVRERPSDLY